MKKTFDYLLSFLPYLYIFIGSLYSPSDPDLGWHLKYGEYFFKNGSLLRENTFSALMPDYKWSNTSWGTDLITYGAYNFGGFFAHTILGALVVAFTFYFFSKAARLRTWDQIFIFPFLLYILSPLNSVSFRGQQISLLFLGILFLILSLYKKNSKILLLTIPLFLIWVNVHGQFILGLIMLSVWIGVFIAQRIIGNIDKAKFFSSFKNSIEENKKEFGMLILVFILSCLATFVNPFGVGVHRDAISHIGSPLLKNIAEYLPFPSLSNAWWNQIIIGVLIGTGLIYLFLKEKLSTQLPTIFSVILLFLLSFSVRRFAWPAYYLVLPLLKPLPGFFKPDSKRNTNIASFVLINILLIFSVFGKFPFDKFQKFDWNKYCSSELMKCTPKSAKYLKEHNLKNDLYSVYSWGGYLIWNHPEIKPTIDGRMHMWRDEKGYSAFEDYYAIEQDFNDIDKSKYNVAYMSPDKPVYGRLNELVSLGKWRVAFRDNYGGVFVRIK